MMQDPNKFDYAEAIAGICRDFPQETRRIFFYDSKTREHMPSRPDADLHMRSLFSVHPYLEKTLHQRMEKFAAEKNSAVMYGPGDEHFIMLYTGDDAISMLGKNAPIGQKLSFVLDHEIGHAVTAYGRASAHSKTLHECCADAYAAMRQIQRFGAETGAVSDLRLRRAQRIVSLQGPRHAAHFTSFTLDKVLEVAQTTPLQKLSAEQTARLAERIAIAHTPNDHVVDNVAKAFKHFQDALAQQPNDDTPYRMLAHTVLNTDDWEVFRWGAPVLRGYLKGDLADMQNGDKLIKVNHAPLEGMAWEGVARDLSQREFAFNREQILFGLDLPAKTAAPRADVTPIRKTR